MAEQRRSLVDDSSDSIGTHATKGPKAKGGGSKAGVKVALIVVCFGAAAVLLAYNFGLIDNPFAEKIKPAPRTAEDNATAEQFNKASENAQKAAKPPALGGS